MGPVRVIGRRAAAYKEHACYRVRKVYLRARCQLSRRLLDARRGVETSEAFDLQSAGLAHAERVRYELSRWLDLPRALRSLEVGPEDVFVDLGSGKGRVVCQAPEHDFPRVIGVELVPELTAIAEANVRAAEKRRRCGLVQLVTCDLLAYDLPDDVTVGYMCNPLRGQSFAAFARRLSDALDRQPRPFFLICNTPLEHEALMATGRFVLDQELPGLRPGARSKLAIRVYRYTGAPALRSAPSAHGSVTSSMA